MLILYFEVGKVSDSLKNRQNYQNLLKVFLNKLFIDMDLGVTFELY